MMKKILRFVAIGLATIVLYSCETGNSEKEEKKNPVKERFEYVKELAKHRQNELFGIFEQELTEEEIKALEFLYAFMPLSDLADYDGEFFLNHVKNTIKIREEVSWGKDIPEDIYTYFILPHRINNENLDSSRIVFYRELKDRVEGLTMYEAALEVNHWCHEKVEYQPTDIRTSSPLATVKTAYGRCGEESTFTVAALRSVCIPARQVYTPRWAHSDDNHAWVEVWADGQWYFLGACEPEPVLNKGWFNEPASRAMLIHSRVFGVYNGQEEINSVNDKFTNINVTDRYAEIFKQNIKIVDTKNVPIDSATVEFQLYNYAEFYPIAKKTTNEDGTTFISTGVGDLLVWAYNETDFGYSKVSVGKQDTVTIILSNVAEDVELSLWPPVAGDKTKIEVSKELIDQNSLALKYEDSIRNAYVATFISQKEFRDTARKTKTDSRLYSYIKQSRGNWNEILNFIISFDKDQSHWIRPFLDQLSDKDLRDTKAEILNDHKVHAMKYVHDYLPEDFTSYILAPRIANEMLVDYRSFLRSEFGDQFISDSRNDVNTLVNWVKDSITINNEEQTYNLPLTPKGVYKLRVADKYSRDIFFVAACRSFGIPARLEPGTNMPQYFWIVDWVDVDFDGITDESSTKYKVSFENTTKGLKFTPQYFHHFTLAVFENNRYNTLELGYYQDIDKIGELNLKGGKYMLLTANRLETGKILTKLDFFEIKKDTVLGLSIPQDTASNYNYGKVVTQTYFEQAKGERVLIKDLLNKHGKIVLGILNPEEEPTKHTLNDIQLVKDELERTGGKIVLIIEKNQIKSFDMDEYDLPSNTILAISNIDPLLLMKAQIKKKQSKAKPIFMVIDKKGTIIYHSEGYKIGIGNDLLKKL